MYLSKEEKEKIVSISSEFKPSLVYLFGSFATGNAVNSSDVDLAILFPRELNEDQRFRKRLLCIEKLSLALKRDVDVVSLNDVSSDLFAFVIVSEGELLFAESREIYVDFEIRAMDNYFDFKPFLEEYDKMYVSKIT